MFLQNRPCPDGEDSLTTASNTIDSSILALLHLESRRYQGRKIEYLLISDLKFKLPVFRKEFTRVEGLIGSWPYGSTINLYFLLVLS